MVQTVLARVSVELTEDSEDTISGRPYILQGPNEEKKN